MMKRSDVKILIIDDEPFIRESLAGFLEDCDYFVSSADSAEQAMDQLRKTPFDIAIVDLRLPGMNGDVFIQDVSRLLPQIRFLIHTGSVDYRLSAELLEIGVRPEHVFYKPQHELALFVDKIEDLLKDRLSP
ncbi:MAG: response regulator [bacterium]